MKKILTTLGLGVATMAFAMNVSVAPVVNFTSINNHDTKSQKGLKVILDQKIKGNFGVDFEITDSSGDIDSNNGNVDTDFYQGAIMPSYTFKLGRFDLKAKIGVEKTLGYTKLNVTNYDDRYKLDGTNWKIGLEGQYKRFLIGISYSKGDIDLNTGKSLNYDFKQTSVYAGISF